MLGTSLVHYYPPKHHPRALRILDDVLSDDEANVPSLMGRGYILQASEDWGEAAELFMRVNGLLPDDVNEGIRAREERAWCALHQGNRSVAADELEAISEILDDLEGRNTDQARCWWRMGKCAWEAKGSYPSPSSLYILTRFCRIRTSIPMFHYSSETFPIVCPRVF
jgi:superkiller protein 3